VLQRLPALIADLIKHEKELVQHLPSNGWGTFENLIEFLCDYLKDCLSWCYDNLDIDINYY